MYSVHSNLLASIPRTVERFTVQNIGFEVLKTFFLLGIQQLSPAGLEKTRTTTTPRKKGIATFGCPHYLLLNAPLDADLDVHLVVYRAARDDVTHPIRLAELEGSLWRSRVALRLYVVSNITTYRMQRHFESVLPFG